MPRSKGKRKTGATAAGDAAGARPLNPLRAGMPAPESIKSVEEVELGGKSYRIIKTDERDEYEEPPGPKRKRGGKR